MQPLLSISLSIAHFKTYLCQRLCLFTGLNEKLMIETGLKLKYADKTHLKAWHLFCLTVLRFIRKVILGLGKYGLHHTRTQS